MLVDGAERDQRRCRSAGSASAGNCGAMLDTHFMLGDARLGIAADPDLLLGFSHPGARHGRATGGRRGAGARAGAGHAPLARISR